MLRSNNPYVVIAQQEWALNLGSNARNIALELSKTRPVLYVNPSLDLKTLLKEIKSANGRRRLKSALGIGRNTVMAGNNLWVHTPATIGLSINWLKSKHLFDYISKLNAIFFFSSLTKAIRSLGWKEKNYIVFNDSQMFTGKYLKKYLDPKLSIYYIRDNLVQHPYFKKHGARVEPQTINNADVIFANSAYLADYAKHYNAKSYDIGQGCELEMYDATKQYPAPHDIAAIPHPRIGYAGFLTAERLDINLLESLAQKQPLWQWVLIGPEEIMFKQSRLHQMKNIHFLGAKKGSELPAYIQHIDVCINPQLINELTVGNYPRKIDEYLAMGKPAVATDTPAMQMFLPHVKLAVGTSQYVSVIGEALMPQPIAEKEAAIAFAKSHTWQACIEKIYNKKTFLDV
ncbi:MAG: glycosyltransferase [Chitinophagaceae bacterium]|nr:glycosyltransferase [Chitinophagaceae bacterium]